MGDWVPHQDLILEAIDQLRRRKARPDAERIYNCLYRRKGLGSNESRIALDRCVENGVVLRVSYKGNISYRNAAKKYARQKRRAAYADLASAGGGAAATGGRLDNKPRRKFTNLLTNTFAELVLQEPDYLDLGIPELHLIKTILDKDSVRYTKKYLLLLLQKEVESGGLVRLESGNFLVGKPQSVGTRRQNGGGHQNGKEQITRIKKEMRNHHVMHRKPTIEVKSDRLKDDADDDVKEEVKSEKSEADDDSEMDEDDDEGSRASSVSERSASSRRAGAATTATPVRGRPPGRARVRYHKRGCILTKTGRMASKRELLTMENMKHALNENSQRVGGRRKKAKKVFDPSESNMPKRRGRPPGSTKNAFKKINMDSDSRPESRASQTGRTEGGVCSVCHIQNKKGPVEKMISCRECSNKAHASCLNGDDMMLKMYPDNTWQCPHCKTCVVCYETSDAGSLVVCSICADAYHNPCHSPRIVEKIKPTTKWLCNNCKMADQLAVDNIQMEYNMEPKNDANDNRKIAESPERTTLSPDLSHNSSPRYTSAPSSPTLPTLSPQTNHNGHDNHSLSGSDSKSHISSTKDDDMDTLDENIDPSIPDASNWSPDEVTQYFAEYFPEEAPVFKEQEIDGHSLLLMRRMDVLKGLHLKLGPALKIYRHVLKLQYRRDDPKLYWA